MKIEIRKFTFKDYLSFLKALKNKQLSEEIDMTPFKYILKKLKDKSLKDSYKFAIVVNKKFAGSINVYKYNKNYEIGFFVLPKYRRRGIANKSVKKVLKFAFRQLKINRIMAQSGINNIVSSRTLKRLGFRKIKIDKKDDNIIWEIKNGNNKRFQ